MDRKRVRERFSTDARKFHDDRVGSEARRIRLRNSFELFERMLPDGHRGLRVLEVAAGTGIFTAKLLDAGFEVTASEINREPLDVLREQLREAVQAQRCRAVLQDAFALGLGSGSFDLVVCMNLMTLLHDRADRRRVLSELSRALVPGGHLLANMRSSNQLGRWLPGPAEIPRARRQREAGSLRHDLRDCGLEPIQIRGESLLPRRPLAALSEAGARRVSWLEGRLCRLPRLYFKQMFLARKRSPA